MSTSKYICNTCKAYFNNNEKLRADNPFDSEEWIYGCPHCFTVDDFSILCDEPNCKLKVTAGTPTAHGYRTTCSTHKPRSVNDYV